MPVELKCIINDDTLIFFFFCRFHNVIIHRICKLEVVSTEMHTFAFCFVEWKLLPFLDYGTNQNGYISWLWNQSAWIYLLIMEPIRMDISLDYGTNQNGYISLLWNQSEWIYLLIMEPISMDISLDYGTNQNGYISWLWNQSEWIYLLIMEPIRMDISLDYGTNQNGYISWLWNQSEWIYLLIMLNIFNLYRWIVRYENYR